MTVHPLDDVRGLQEEHKGDWTVIVREHQRETLGLTKVGWALRPEDRLREIQTGNPYGLELLASFTGTRLSENRVHQSLAAWRIRGEWFALGNSWRLIEDAEGGDSYALSALVQAVRHELEAA